VTTVSSFLLQPANVRVKAKRVTADNDTSFFPILSSPPFPSRICGKLFWLGFFYRISLPDLQGDFQSEKATAPTEKIIDLAQSTGLSVTKHNTMLKS
jgi:hypothetical protein